MFDVLPEDLTWNVTGWLVYNKDAPLPDPAVVDEFNHYDDFTLVPLDKEPLFPEADQTITLDVISKFITYRFVQHAFIVWPCSRANVSLLTVDNLGDGKPYAFFNNISYTPPKVPILYTAMTTGEDAANPLVYGEFTHPFVLEKDQIIDIVVNNIGEQLLALICLHI